MGGAAYLDRGGKYELRYRSITFYTARYELKITTHDEGSPFEYVAVPDDANSALPTNMVMNSHPGPLPP